MASQHTAALTEAQSLLELCQWKERLQKQRLDVAIDLKEATLSDEQLRRSEDQLEKLKSEHEEVFVNRFTARNISERIQLTTEALRYIFPDNTGPDPQRDNKVVADRSQRIQDLMARQREITGDILTMREGITNKKNALYELRQKNQELRHQNRQTMLAIKEVHLAQKSNKHKQRIAQTEDELQKVVDRITVQRHVFQSLIVGSGINWAQDEKLLNRVVELSQTLDLDT